MIETLWTICAWTGFVWWSCLCIVVIFVIAAVAGGVAESLCWRWEHEQLRRIADDIIAASNDDDLPAFFPERAAVADPESKPSQAVTGEPLTEAGNSSETNARLPLGGQGKGTPQTPRRDGGRDRTLPANWQDQDTVGSFDEAWAEMRRRKTGGA